MKREGYIAATAAAMIAVLVTVIVAAVGFIAYLGRGNIAGSYYKERSRALAEACVNVALLALAGDPAYAGGETKAVDSDTCEIKAITVQGNTKLLEASAGFAGARTVFRVSVDANDLSLVGWEEVKN
ncbi:MAG: hypothetical protein HY460_03040 [Parcubacteria group bacterium]|nr:hypothetical protein [Parcubacteria group bacterium]